MQSVAFFVYRDLIGQAHKENRVLLTRDAKLLRHQYTLNNQIYRVKSLLKNEQLLEVCLVLVVTEFKRVNRRFHQSNR